MKKLLVYIGTLLLFSGTVQAQYMSGSVFLNGRYLETVVAPNGSMISSSPPPPGYHVGAGTAGRTYGLVADPDKDGWLIGFPPFTGDYTAFGYPIEDWILFADGNTARPDVGKWDTGITSGMKGVNTRYIATAKETGSEWQGKWNDLELRQLTTVSLDGLHIRVNIEFNNKGTTTIRDIYYARSCDPDIDGEFCKAVPPGSCLGLSTHNKIVNQSPDPKSRVWAYAQGDSLDYIMGITTNDCRAKAFFLEWNLRVTVRLDSLYNELVPYARYSVGYNFYTDAAMGLVFKLDSLKAGESTSISFAYILDSTEIDTIASSAFIPQWSYKGTLYQKHDTIPACENMPMDISLLAPGPGTWVWDASPYLATRSGPVNTITVKDTNTFRAIRTGCGQPDTMYLTVCGIPVVRPVLSLSGNTISVSPSGYAGYQWYRDGVLIPGATLAPYIASKAGKYFVRATDANGCISNSDTVDFSILSVNEPATARHIRIFPNPSSSIVQIAAPFPLQATLTDLSGRVLLHRKEARELDLSSFADGLYLLRLADAEGRIISTQKLLKQRDL